MNIYYDKDCDPSALKNKKIAILGFGNQGHAHALNLTDSGLNVRVGLRKNSASIAKAKSEGLEVGSIRELCTWGDLIMNLLPDEVQADVYKKEIAPVLNEHKTLLFAHGFNIHYKQIEPPKNMTIALIAPKGVGAMVRTNYLKGFGVPCLLAIQQDPQQRALNEALCYAHHLGCGQAGILETTFAEETETDLFGEQTVLCGGLSALIKAAFETLVDAGYAPELAYFECLHEVKLIADLLYKGGLTQTRQAISNTAQFGDLTRGPRIINDQTKKEMQKILSEIQDGTFAKEWLEEVRSGKENFNQLTQTDERHLMETVGRKLRSMIPEFKEKS